MTDFMTDLCFCNEVTFHVKGKVSKRNIRIWGTENPLEILEHVRDFAKMNVFCSMSKNAVYGTFFFEGATVNDDTYLDMLEKWLMARLNEEESDNFILVQDRELPHWSLRVDSSDHSTA